MIPCQTTFVQTMIICLYLDANDVGCYLKTSVVTSGFPLESDSDPFRCIYVCGLTRSPYALLADGGDCFCTNTLGTTKGSRELCEVPCTSKKALTCGGKLHYGVYKVTEFDNATAHVSAPKWTKEDEPVTLSFNADDDAVFRVYRKHSEMTTTLSSLEMEFQDPGIEVIYY